MTATQHNLSTIYTDSLPTAIRRLEAAGPGDLATAEGGHPCAMKMEPDSGRPWLLDPWGHQGAPARVTTATVAQMGYRTDAEPAPHAEPDDTEEAVEAHVETLRAAGFDGSRLAEASGLSLGTARRMLRGVKVSRRSRRQALAVDPDTPIRPHPPTLAEQAEDLEWLLDSGTPAEKAARRCGYSSADSARQTMSRAGNSDLANRLSVPRPEPEPESLDDYDPYTDPEFKEN